MNKITLYPKKFSYRDYDDGSFKNLTFEYIDRHLWSFVEVNHSVTARTLMEIMKMPDVSFWQHALSEPYLPELMEYYDSKLTEKQESPFDSLRFSWRGEFWDWKDEEKSQDEELSISMDVSGYTENDPDNPEGMYSLSFTPLKDLIDLPISIDHNFSIRVIGDRNETRMKEFPFGIKTPTLLELLKAFVYEVTFMGSEEDKEDKLEEMNQRIEDIKSGKEKTYSFGSVEEMMDHFKNKLKDGDEDDNIEI
jgi:hypothetical protein